MTQSTDGQICYGILFDGGTKFPWDTDKYDGKPEEWWLSGVLGFRPSFAMFTPQGRWIGGVRWPQEKIDEYYGERRKFEKANPLFPVTLVNYCSGDFSMYILAVPSTCIIANRGYPTTFTPSDLQVTGQQKEALINFCNEHKIKYDGEPAWYLSSYWG